MSFIRFHKADEVVTQYNYIAGIQLLTKDPKPYTQVIDGNISGSYEVHLIDCYGNEFDVTEHIRIRNFEDKMVFKIIYLPYDFGSLPVYFKLTQTGIDAPALISNKFLLTRQNEKYTSRIDYVERGVYFATMGLTQTAGASLQSIRLQFYKNNLIDGTEVETYYQITRSQTINQRISVKEYTQYATLPISEIVLSELANAFYGGMCYVNQVRNYIVEGFDRSEREGMSNISENIFLADPDEKDKINIIDEIIDPDLLTVPFLASSDRLSSSGYLVSQEFIQI